MIWKKRVLIPLLALALVVNWHCRTQRGESSIVGNIKVQNGWKPTLYLVQPRSFGEIAANFSGKLVDSVKIKKGGNFKFKSVYATEEPILYEIFVQPSNSIYPNKISSIDPKKANYLPIVVKNGDKIVVQADAENLQASARVLGSNPNNEVLMRLRDYRIAAFDQFQRAAEGEENHEDEAALLEKEDRLARYRSSLMAFADSTDFFEAALVAIRWVSPESDYERVPEFLYNQCQRWSTILPEHTFSQQLCSAGQKDKLPIMVGDHIPDFEMPLPNGDSTRLYSFFSEKKLTILDLWASWCAPCRKENREILAPLWDSYREKGLQIVGYSIDSSPEAWQKAIVKDGARWVHASHLSGDDSPFLETLRLTTIPANFILDKDGQIVAKNLHGKALSDFVVKYFNK